MWITKNKRQCWCESKNNLISYTYVGKQMHAIQVRLDKHLFPIVKPFHELQEASSNFVVVVSKIRK
jgi:hypothetical protein